MGITASPSSFKYEKTVVKEVRKQRPKMDLKGMILLHDNARLMTIQRLEAAGDVVNLI
jgi:hypothetical protein